MKNPILIMFLYLRHPRWVHLHSIYIKITTTILTLTIIDLRKEDQKLQELVLYFRYHADWTMSQTKLNLPHTTVLNDVRADGGLILVMCEHAGQVYSCSRSPSIRPSCRCLPDLLIFIPTREFGLTYQQDNDIKPSTSETVPCCYPWNHLPRPH